MNRRSFYGDDGNNVDFSQRHSASIDPDEEEEFSKLPDWAAILPAKYGLEDMAKRNRFHEYQVKKITGQLDAPKQKAEEPEEEPSLTREADDKFWGNPKEQQRIYRERRGKL